MDKTILFYVYFLISRIFIIMLGRADVTICHQFRTVLALLIT